MRMDPSDSSVTTGRWIGRFCSEPRSTLKGKLPVRPTVLWPQVDGDIFRSQPAGLAVEVPTSEAQDLGGNCTSIGFGQSATATFVASKTAISRATASLPASPALSASDSNADALPHQNQRKYPG